MITRKVHDLHVVALILHNRLYCSVDDILGAAELPPFICRSAEVSEVSNTQLWRLRLRLGSQFRRHLRYSTYWLNKLLLLARTDR